MAELRYRRGLVVGKFSPLHRGHQLVIDRAFESCAEVVLLSYSVPELPGCESARRHEWLSGLYPTARVLVVPPGVVAGWGEVPPNSAPDAVHHHFCALLCLNHLGGPVDVVFSSEAWGAAFAAALEVHFRAAGLAETTVASVVVDRNRLQYPLSGTAVRQAAVVEPGRLDPLVANTWKRRVAVLGGESTGKTTLAAALASAWGCPWVPEYGRERWEARGGVLEPADLVAIAVEQVAREERALANHSLVVGDTSPLVTTFYSEWLFGAVDQQVAHLAQRHYHLTILCAPDIPFEQDGTRTEPPLRDLQHRWYLDHFERSGIPFVMVAGPVAERVARASAALWSGEGIKGSGLKPGGMMPMC